MIAVDTNILVYAHRRDSIFHAVAKDRIVALAAGRAAWAIPWPCIHEFLAVVTRAFDPPSTPVQATAQVEAWLESTSVVLLGETDEHWQTLKRLILSSKVTAGRIHDARIAALCIEHGVRELWSADRDFSRFVGLKSVNPLVR